MTIQKLAKLRILDFYYVLLAYSKTFIFCKGVDFMLYFCYFFIVIRF